jgi:serine/threonine-protein kinase
MAPEVLDLCSRCLHRDPAERPTALVAALLLAEAVDARVYVPLMDVGSVMPRPSPVSAWDERAAEAPTSMALSADPEPDTAYLADRPGRHRAG